MNGGDKAVMEVHACDVLGGDAEALSDRRTRLAGAPAFGEGEEEMDMTGDEEEHRAARNLLPQRECESAIAVLQGCASRSSPHRLGKQDEEDVGNERDDPCRYPYGMKNLPMLNEEEETRVCFDWQTWNVDSSGQQKKKGSARPHPSYTNPLPSQNGTRLDQHHLAGCLVFEQFA